MRLGKIAIRNLTRNSKRSLLSIIATGIATFSITFLFAFIGGLSKDMEDIAVNYLTGEILVRNSSYDEISYSLDRAIDNYKDVLTSLKIEMPSVEFSPRINFPSTIFDKKDWDKSYVSNGVAVDFETEESFLGLKNKIIKGTMPKESRDVIMGYGLAEELGLDIGDKFTPITATRLGASAGITFRITALAKFSDSAFTNKTFIVSLEELPKMLRMEGAVSDILIKGFGKKDLLLEKKKVEDILKKYGYDNLEALSWKESSTYEFIGMAQGIYSIMAFFFFFMASSVIANTMLMVVFERRKEIGTITAMGMTSREVVRLFFTEAFMLGLIGAFLGVVLGIATIIPFSIIGIDLSQMSGSVDFNASFFIYPQLKFSTTSFVFIYSVFIASVVSFFPSKGAAKVDPVVALRSE